MVPAFGEEPFAHARETILRWQHTGLHLAVVSCCTQPMIDEEMRRLGLGDLEAHGVGEKSETLLGLKLQWGGGVFLGDHASDLRAAQVAEIPFLQSRLHGGPMIEGASASFMDWSEAALLIST